MLGKYMKYLLISIVLLSTVVVPLIGAVWGLYLWLWLNNVYGVILLIASASLFVNDIAFYMTQDFI